MMRFRLRTWRQKLAPGSTTAASVARTAEDRSTVCGTMWSCPALRNILFSVFSGRLALRLVRSKHFVEVIKSAVILFGRNVFKHVRTTKETPKVSGAIRRGWRPHGALQNCAWVLDAINRENPSRAISGGGTPPQS